MPRSFAHARALRAPGSLFACVALAIAPFGAIACSSGGGGSSGSSTAASTVTPVPAETVGGPAAAPVQGPKPEARAVWVSRWYANTEAKIHAAIDLMDRLGMNMLFLQVNGDGYALYPSTVAPKSPLIAQGFDALAVAIPYAHARGIEVHAWINAVRVYTGASSMPNNTEHILRKHPEWSMVNASGARSFDLAGTGEGEIFACPEHPGFFAWTMALVHELAQRYPIDGLHLDYIRYPSGTSHCYCDSHRQNFTAQHGRAPTAADPDWRAFRFATINRLVVACGQALRAHRPEAMLSATTTRFFSFQDPKAWFRDGELDVHAPMLYTSNLGIFASETAAHAMNADGRLVLPGIAVTGSVLGEQVDLSRLAEVDGFALFASNQIGATEEALLRARLPQRAPVPPMPWRGLGVDVTAPRLGAVQVAPGQTEATFAFVTDERTRGRVEVRAAGESWPSAFVVEPASAALVQDHAITVRGLAPQTSYTAHVVAVDAAGNWRSSEDVSFTTIAPGPIDVILDNGGLGYQETGSWTNGGSPGGFDGTYRYAGTNASLESATATYQPTLPEGGLYKVSVYYLAGTNRAKDATFTVHSNAGAQGVLVDQSAQSRTWVELGTFRFDAGAQGFVRLSNRAAGGSVVIADAVRFERIAP